MYRYIGDTFAQQQQQKDSFTKNGCLDKQKKNVLWFDLENTHCSAFQGCFEADSQ